MGGDTDNKAHAHWAEGGSIEREVYEIEQESRQFEEETRLWSDAIRLASPPLVPGLPDLEAAAETLWSLSAAALEHAHAGSPEQSFLKSVHDRALRLLTDIRDHEKPRPDKK